MNFVMKAGALQRHGSPIVLYVPHLFHQNVTPVEFSHLWSLCVEEQFYLIWPLVVWLVPKRKHLMWICAGLILVVVCLRTYLYLHSSFTEVQTDYLYVSTYTRADTLLVGAWIALWLRGAKLSRTGLRKIAFHLTTWNVGLLVLLVHFFQPHQMFTINSPVLLTVGYTFVAFAAAGLILSSLDASSLVHRVLLHPQLAHLGRISYGFYFFHMLPRAFFGLNEASLPHHGTILIFPLAFAFSYGSAYLSFRFLESPFLRMKNVLAPGHSSIPAGTEEYLLPQPNSVNGLTLSRQYVDK